MIFDSSLDLVGPPRMPRQMLSHQEYLGERTIHDDEAAASLGLHGAPIEGVTHFSQFDPLASLIWGQHWFERGCISAHFQNMVVEGETVRASMSTVGPNSATISAAKDDGTPVLGGTASVGPTHLRSAVAQRMDACCAPQRLRVLDQLTAGMTTPRRIDSVSAAGGNGDFYPFSLADKLERITEPHDWYTETGGPSSPWGRQILPIEMISVLVLKDGHIDLPVRRPSLSLFLDLEIRLLDGPVFVGHEYEIAHTVVALSESRRTESFFMQSTINDPTSGNPIASLLLHEGTFKDSYTG